MRQNYKRFVKPIEGVAYQSEYDMDSAVIQDPITRDTAPLIVTTIDVSVAGTKILNIPGRAFVPYFFDLSSTNKERVDAGFVNVYMNTVYAEGIPFPAKHNRGYRGSFTQLFLSWPAQANTAVDFVILRSKYTPWMTDDINPNNLNALTWVSEAPAGVINGINTVFTTTSAPIDPNATELYLDGIFQRPGIDYTMVGNTITFAVAPAVAQDIWIKYLSANSGTITFASEVPAGIVNGINAVFNLSTVPVDANSLSLYKNGLFQRPGVDYTLALNVITFTAPPALASDLWAIYRNF